MSDGGKEEGKVPEHSTTRKPAGNEDFVRALAMISVAQICENEGFQGFQQSALQSLADIAVRYIREIGKTANIYAKLSGRSECNVFDIIQGLEDLGSIQGFLGASDVHHSLANSGTIGEIIQYVSLIEEIPFVYSLPSFPFSREHKPPPSFCQKGEEPPAGHIPVWLPAFPHVADDDPPTCNDEKNSADKVEKNREPPSNSMNVQSQLNANNGFRTAFFPDLGDSSKSKRTTDVNPFLATPLAYGEKEVSLVDNPSKLLEGDAVASFISVTDIAAPVTEVARNKIYESEERNKDIRLQGRLAVQLEFSSARKSLPTFRNVIAGNNVDDQPIKGLGNNDENCEKK